ncbi:SagB family peptide dehydrogenase [uncultured Tateyamaria sp.]|uniref:SagB family peptide dehydrogenase n=1 Tax=uncultured Tateyamaria sp. TaxID=455651 RepID=UPI00262F9EF0|nr:SagB family peptide dehydrogenase [uncultured Tateyamaria sp.]
MNDETWSNALFPDAPSDEDYVWELFHENSKTGRYGHYVPDDRVASRMIRMTDSLSYEGYPVFDLPDPGEGFDVPLGEALVGRVSPKGLEPVALPLAQLSSILYAGYGVTRMNETTDFLRPFRTVPSGGALYPLEIYLTGKHVDGLKAGLYHFSPPKHRLHLLRTGDLAPELSQALVEFQADLAFDASVILIVTALFERSTFKYGARGYRFALMEAGHSAQNINLAATALNLGCYNLGGFYDRTVDAFLGLDGLHQSTVYMIAIGGRTGQHEAPHRFTREGGT